jgi:hypothetical protein
MTRTLARRLATVGGALGIAVLACAGTASADASDPHAASGNNVLATNAADSAHDAGLLRGDDWGNCPCPPPPPCRPCPPPCPPHDGWNNGWDNGWYGHHDHDRDHDGLLSDVVEDLL